MKRLTTTDPTFPAAFAALVADGRDTTSRVDAPVTAIIADVRARGDAALIDYTTRFDRQTLTPGTLRVTASEIDDATASITPALTDALDLAATRIEAFHRAQMPADLEHTDTAGLHLGMRWTPLDAVGLYVPGGKAAYPSSVLMNALPARVAGVGRIAMTVPCPGGHLEPLVLAAARRAGVSEIYRVGGAQAVAALAYGTATIAPVDRIVGPGNAYVAEAKRQVFGRVGIDSIAGPSEVVIMADAAQNPADIAIDLLAQAEHDEAAQSILVTTDPALADAVALAVDEALQTLPAPPSPPPPGATTAASSSPATGTKPSTWSTTSPPNTSRSWSTPPATCSPASATPAPPSSAAPAPKPSATTSPAPTTCCPPVAPPASPPASPSSTSSSAPPGSSATRPPLPASAPPPSP